jgi:non-ribosomal peptide synthetase component F
MANLFLEATSAAKSNQDSDFVVAVIGNVSDVLVSIFLAVLKMGAAYLPIDSRFPLSRVEHILSESKPILILYDEKYKHASILESFNTMRFEDIFREIFTMSSENIHGGKVLTVDSPDHRALICYTSGSTGIIKGVRLSHRTLHQRINWQIIAYPFYNTETHCVFKTPVSFIDHVGELWCPLVSSKTLVIVPRDYVANTEKFISILEVNKIQRLVLVPSLLQNILIAIKTMPSEPRASTSSKRESSSSKHESISTRHGSILPGRESNAMKRESNSSKPEDGSEKLLTNLRLWISSGDVLSTKLASDFFEYFEGNGEKMLMNCYGATEALDCASYELQSKKQIEKFEKIPLGLPAYNTMLYVIDPETDEPAGSDFFKYKG